MLLNLTCLVVLRPPCILLMTSGTRGVSSRPGVSTMVVMIAGLMMIAHGTCHRVEVVNERQLENALSSQAVTIIELVDDIKLTWGFWRVHRDKPIEIGRNLVIASSKVTPSNFAVLDFNFQPPIVSLSSNGSLSIKHLQVRGLPRSPIFMDYIAPSRSQIGGANPSVVYDNVVVRRNVCVDEATASQQMRNLEYKSEDRTATIERLPQWCLGTECNFAKVLNITQYVGRTASDDLFTFSYLVSINNVTVVCDKMLEKDCQETRGSDFCLSVANDYFIEEAKKGEQEHDRGLRGWRLGLTIASGPLGGVIIVVIMVWLLGAHFRSRRARYSETMLDRYSGDKIYSTPDDITLGLLLGSGSTGRVYQGTWRGALVAIKVILHSIQEAEKVRHELDANLSFNHLNVVRALHIARIHHKCRRAGEMYHSQTPSPPQATLIPFKHGPRKQVDQGGVPSHTSASKLYASDHGGMHIITFSNTIDFMTSKPVTAPELENHAMSPLSSPDVETWLVLEMCDKGALSQLVTNKAFMDDNGMPIMHAILLRLLDIACGMAYIHSFNICHGDLKCDNVLLCSNEKDPYGFIAKIADFGLARALKAGQTHLSTQRYGTVTHMPPELLLSGQLRPACDVYSFGIMMWEMAAGRRPFVGVTHGEIVRMVVIDDARPSFNEYSRTASCDLHGPNREFLHALQEFSSLHSGSNHSENPPVTIVVAPQPKEYMGYFDDDKSIVGTSQERLLPRKASMTPDRPVEESSGKWSTGDSNTQGDPGRPPRPNGGMGVPREYIRLAQECWQRDAMRRPRFDDIIVRLEELLRKYPPAV